MIYFLIKFGIPDVDSCHRKDIPEETPEDYFAKIVYSPSVIVFFFFLQDNKLGIGPLSWAIYWEQTDELGKDMTRLKLNTWLWCMRIINLLTVYLVRKHFPINHPIGHVEDVLGQLPWWLLIGKENGLPGNPKTHQHHQHNDDKVHHVYHLEGWESRGRNKKTHMTECSNDTDLDGNLWRRFTLDNAGKGCLDRELCPDKRTLGLLKPMFMECYK